MTHRTDLVSLSAGERICFGLALASLPCQTCNVVDAVPEPAKQEQHVSIGRMVATGPSAPVQVRAPEQCFSVGLHLILPYDAQKLLDSGAGDALMRDVHLVEAVRNSLLPILSTRAPARSHGVSVPLALLSCRIRIVAGATRKCDLGRYRARAPPRFHAVSLGLCCCFSFRFATSPELQVQEPFADLVSSGDGETPCPFALAPAVLQCQTQAG